MLIVIAVWGLSIPVFAVLALRMWLKRSRRDLPPLRSLLGLSSLLVVLASWLLFGRLAYCGQIGGFGTHYITTRSADTFFFVSFFAAMGCAAFKDKSRIFAVLSGSLMAALWAGAQMVA